MATVASVRPDKSSSTSAVRRQLSEAAAQELATLRAALDQKLAALEAALAGPAPGASLETLVIDLARVATAEAEAATAKACLDAQVEAEREAAARAEAQRALKTERENAATQQRDLEQARTALKSERDTATLLRRDLGAAADALKNERQTAARLRQQCEEAEKKLAAERKTSAALRRDVDDARNALKAAQQAGIELSQSVEPAHAAVEQEREVNARLTEALARTQQDLAAATSLAEQRAGDIEAAQSLIDGLEHQRSELERARDEHATRAALALQERDTVGAELGTLRQDADRATSLAEARAQEFGTARTEYDRLLHDLRGRLDTADRERASLAAELDAAREALNAAHAQAEQRSEKLAHDHAEGERLLADASARLDAALRDRDALAAELETVRHAVQAARTESGTLLGAADDERQRIERALKDAEAQAGRAIRDRDMMAEELELMRESLATVQSDAQLQLEAAQQTAARRIAELEAVLEDRDREQSDRRSRPPALTAARSTRPVRPDHTPPAVEPTLAPRSDADPPVAAAAPGASRVAFREELEVLVDGSPATLVDLSITGAQVISHAAMKPNRMVRLQLPGDGTPITCKGRIVWARLEAGPTSVLHYRAGLVFTAVDEQAVETFLAQHADGRTEG
jgi:chromosome segregation ATPase